MADSEKRNFLLSRRQYKCRRILCRQESIYSCVGTRIKEKRKYLGLSIVRLAEDMGITQQQFNRYERGTYTLSDVSGRNVPCSGG
ncbi:helix-turn-helix domain-containing protein [Morganella morganii]|uniref:helix-turn-helix domain-containing protein n=1 Tax=Morganella morganii TaxID=582 RepID=UPI001FFC7BE5|nr:helix-turn-helix transcriptional regulator [Morganella morganii]